MLSSAEANLLLITNPSPSNGTGIALFLNLSKIICTTAATTAVLRLYANPTVSGAGSAKAAVNCRTAYGVTRQQSVVTSGPTTSANGTLVDVVGSSAFLSAESKHMIVLDPGQSLLVTVQGSAASSCTSIVSFFEM